MIEELDKTLEQPLKRELQSTRMSQVSNTFTTPATACYQLTFGRQ